MKSKVYCSLPQQTCLRFVGFSAEWLTAHWNDITIMCQHVNWHFAVKMSMICPVVQKQTPLLSAITFQTIWQINYIPDVRCLKMVLSCHLSVIKLSTPCDFLFIFLFSQSSSLKESINLSVDLLLLSFLGYAFTLTESEWFYILLPLLCEQRMDYKVLMVCLCVCLWTW